MQFCVFFLFLFKGSSKCGFFPPCCPVQVLSCALCLHHVFLSEQIKMMMMMMMMMIMMMMMMMMMIMMNKDVL